MAAGTATIGRGRFEGQSALKGGGKVTLSGRANSEAAHFFAAVLEYSEENWVRFDNTSIRSKPASDRIANLRRDKRSRLVIGIFAGDGVSHDGH